MKDTPHSKFDVTTGLDPDFEELEDTQVEATRTNLIAEAPGEDVSDKDLRNDAMNPEGWLFTNKGLEQHGYNPADRITPENADSLSREYMISEYTGFQNQPIVVPGDPPVMYWVNAVPQKVQAVNARTGEPYWTLEYKNENLAGLAHANRGVAVWQDKVYLGSLDNNVVAIDRYKGDVLWETKTLTDHQRSDMVKPKRMANTQAPLVYDGKVFKGQTGYYGGWGAHFAVDAENGDILWDHEVIPKHQWVGDSWRHGDAAPWNLASIDHETGTLFRPTGNPAPMFNGIPRPGPNRDSQSVIAVDLETGEVQWKTQFVAHDWHDYDTYNTRVIEMEVDGEQQRVVEAVNKTGWVYFLDIETGKIIERTEAYALQGGEVPFMGWLPHGKDNKKSVFPSDRGATEWCPDAWSPDTGFVYIGGNDHGIEYAWTDYEYDEELVAPQTGGVQEKLDPEEHHKIANYMVAIDPASGEVQWKHHYEVDESNTGFARSGGTTVTGGKVAFGGSSNGQLVAVNAETGDFLWRDKLSDKFRGVTASPITWDDPAAGKQYVALASLDGIGVYSVEA